MTAFVLVIDAAAVAAVMRGLFWLLAVLFVALYTRLSLVVWRMGCEPPRNTVPLWLRVLVSVFWPIASIVGVLMGWWQQRRARKVKP